MEIKDIKTKQWVEIGFLIAAIIAAILTGVLDANMWGLSATILLSTIAAYFIYTILREQTISNKIDEKAEDLSNTFVNSIDDVRKIKNIRTFMTIQEVDKYLIQRMETAQKIYDLTWEENIDRESTRDKAEQEEINREYKRVFCKFCSDSTKIYREIFTFSETKHIKAMDSHIEDGGEIYECKYFDSNKNSKFPKLQFVIIDGKEIVFALGIYEPYFYAIADKNFIRIFMRYFNQAWDNGIWIKESQKTVNITEVSKIKKQYSKNK